MQRVLRISREPAIRRLRAIGFRGRQKNVGPRLAQVLAAFSGFRSLMDQLGDGNLSGIFYRYPASVFLLAFTLQCAAAYLGYFLRRRGGPVEEQVRKDFATILPSALTLLALIIGFSFSMAADRYDQRKVLEEAEANAIGTEYVRADLLPAAQAAQVKFLLKVYTQSRIAFYENTNWTMLPLINNQTATLQNDLWHEASKPALAMPNPVIALVVAGMNDVLNSQGYTQAAWWNRLPADVWMLQLLVAISANFLFGYSEHRDRSARLMLLPFIVSLPFFLIADIDSPRGGLIHIKPQNLIALQKSFGSG
jgi:hypothetical protein